MLRSSREEAIGMKYGLCFAAGLCWVVVGVIRVMDAEASTVGVLVSFAAAAIFLAAGIFYFWKERK